MVAGFTLIAFRKPLLEFIKQFTSPETKKAKIGPIAIERELGELAEKGNRAVENVKRLNQVMAESRLLELEITLGKFGSAFTPEQPRLMDNQINEPRGLTH